MDRKGYAPINLAGLVVAFENDSSSRKPAPRKDVTTPPKTGNMMAERPMQAANTDIIEEKPKIPISIEGAVWSFVKMMERGSNKQLAAMNKLYVRASTNFPQKFYRYQLTRTIYKRNHFYLSYEHCSNILCRTVKLLT